MRGDRKLVLAGLCAVLGTAGCWAVPAQGPDRTAHNPFETTITAGNVGSLVEVWSAPLDGPTPPYPRGGMVVHNGGLFVNDVEATYRLDKNSGTRKWRTPVLGSQPDREVGHPMVVRNRVLASEGTMTGVGAGVWESYWLDPVSGARSPDDGYGLPVAVRGTRVAYDLPGCVEPEICFGNLRVLDLDDPTWTRSAYLEAYDDGFFFGEPGPEPSTLGRDRVYQVGLDPRIEEQRIVPFVRAISLTSDNATVAWTVTPDPETMYTAPVLSPDESVVYVGTTRPGAPHRPGERTTVYALDAGTGATIWSADVGASVAASPALADGKLYVPTNDGDLVVLDAAGCGAPVCAPLWWAPTGSRIHEQPAVAGGVVYTGSVDGTVHAFAAAGCGTATCGPLWSDANAGSILYPPVVTNGKLYVLVSASSQTTVVAYGAQS